jgi:nitroreductase
MDTTTVLHSRFSCRSYAAEPVSRERILELLGAARWAPSA